MHDWNLEDPEKFLKKFFNSKKHTEDDIETCMDALEFLVNNKNSKEASLTLGSMYYTGDIIPQDFSLAKKYYEIASNLGSSRAGLNLGYIYYYGRCDDKPDYEKAFKAFSKASNINDEDDVKSEALYKLSDMYWNGLYVEQDKEYAKKLVYPLLPRENMKSSYCEPNVLGDILTRLANFTAKENVFSYDVYDNWKYARLARKVISDRYDGTWWGDKKVLDKLEVLNKNIDQYCIQNNISFDYTIDNPKDYKFFSWFYSFEKYEGPIFPVGLVKSKVNNNLLFIVDAHCQYISIPEINFVNMAAYMFIVFEDADIVFNNINEDENYPAVLCSKKDGFDILGGDKVIASIKMSHKSKTYISQIVVPVKEELEIIKREDFKLSDYSYETEVDA